MALDKRYKKLEKDLGRSVEKILLFLERNGVGLEIYLMGSAKMKQLNHQHRGRNAATNVLAFEMPKNFPQVRTNFLGEVYLCPAYIKKHGEDIQSLLIHGILHLIGFNHTRVSDRMVMEKIEKAVAVFLREQSERGRKSQPST